MAKPIFVCTLFNATTARDVRFSTALLSLPSRHHDCGKNVSVLRTRRENCRRTCSDGLFHSHRSEHRYLKTFSGKKRSSSTCANPVRRLVLNALELEITDASLDGEALPKSAIKIDSGKRTAHDCITIGVRHRTDSPWRTCGRRAHARAQFSGKINQQDRGFFTCITKGWGAAQKKSCSERNLKRLMLADFPLLGRPAFRARFQLTAVVPENWLAVSNMPIEIEKKIEGGKEVRFAATPQCRAI